ncbi:MAG: hypothetical protein HOC21_00855 [Phycisphaerae bacterium]|nr:hypothetical protein [Phycisphaerae bacterium]
MESNQRKKHDISGPVAWTLSIGVHIGVALIAFFITWSVIRDEGEPPQVVTSTWHEQPVLEEAILPMVLPPKPVIEEPAEVEQEPVEVAGKEKPLESVQDGLAVLHTIATTGEVPERAVRKPEAEVKFMGLDAVAAKRIVYVVDASGSMLLHLTTVLDELERSLRTLHPKQEFGILFFQQKKAIAVPPKGELVSATAKNINKAMRWIDTSGKVIPAGGSNPIIALKSAMRLHPDVIYLLSENITGAGRYEVPADELLEAINKLNPVDKRNGLRKVQINCIQYLSQDVAGTMRKIAEIHGGDDGYTFIERGRVGK